MCEGPLPPLAGGRQGGVCCVAEASRGDGGGGGLRGHVEQLRVPLPRLGLLGGVLGRDLLEEDQHRDESENS